MLFILGIIAVLLVIITCVSNSLTERKAEFGRCEKMGYPNSPKQHCYKGKKRDMGGKDLHVLATILSAGLVDADPTTLQHLKEYRDLRGGSN
ncbi:hypothetical protein SKAU_G00218810 [Synaphobranchus kaupii]|uniref:Uncharacterized protein n=1 Tax=Synaphobranchus kaupii TaxID=118154 RepID=A0A9Q1FAB8_SYNKA|nr:hypothetical protein SKAU_G00218810 [Synaphobranchus kaupii]